MFVTYYPIIMSTVIFDTATGPTLDEYLQVMASKPVDKQENLLKDSVHLEWLKEPCYAGGNTVKFKGSLFWSHQLSRACKIPDNGVYYYYILC
jgi:hypothetical protein